MAFPVLDALKEGFEVYVVADAIGGISTTAHEAALQRMQQAGAILISVIGLAGELQRDWAHPGGDRLRSILHEYFSRHHELRSKR